MYVFKTASGFYFGFAGKRVIRLFLVSNVSAGNKTLVSYGLSGAWPKLTEPVSERARSRISAVCFLSRNSFT